MEVQGKIIAALPERTGESRRNPGEKWVSQEFVVESTDGQYTRKMVFTVFGADRLQRFNIQVGQSVNIAFDIDAHEWNGRWFNDIRAYDVRLVDLAQPVPSSAVVSSEPVPAGAVAAPGAAPLSQPAPAAPQTSASQAPASGDPTEDLPF